MGPNTTVEDYVASLTGPVHDVAQALQELIESGLDDAEPSIWHGQPVWKVDDVPVAGFKAHGDYVTFMLWRGQDIADSSGRLQPSGSAQMATVKLQDITDHDTDLLLDWLNQARDLDEQ